MHKTLCAAVALVCATPAFAQSAPEKGAFGLGANLSLTDQRQFMDGGLQMSFWALDRLKLTADLGLASVENGGTGFGIMGGLDYFLVKDASWGAFVGGDLGVNIIDPELGDSTTQIVFAIGGGAEYYFSKHFSALVFQGLQFNTEPTTFALVSRVGLNWYF